MSRQALALVCWIVCVVLALAANLTNHAFEPFIAAMMVLLALMGENK